MADYNTKVLIDDTIAESKDSDFSRSLVLTYLQRTQDMVLGRSRFKFSEDVTESVLSAGSFTYDYECDHQEIIQLILIDNSTTRPTIYQPNYLAPNEFFDLYPDPETTTVNPPFNYTDFNGQIWFPAPLDRVYTVKMRYIERPRRLSDSTSSCPLIPVEFKDIMIKGGLSGIEQYRENFDISAVYQRNIEDLTEDMLSRYSPRKMGPGKSRTRGLSYGNTPIYYGNMGITNGPL